MKRRFQCQGGQALIEYALTCAVVLPLLLGVLDGGQMFWQYVTLSHAANVGARYASVHGAKSAAADPDHALGPATDYATAQALVKDAIMDRVIGLARDDLDVQVSWPDGNNRVGSLVKVKLSYPLQPVTPLYVRSDVPATSESTMQIQH